MYLKTLTIKGFKSFADATTIELEPGVTVIVGPNGSGKSNVVDAVAWVLGAQGPRVVRSAKMDDVIFAGTERRAALGRAEVSLTIDNAARRLPIEFNEVTVTRTLFRTGESEYAINGAPCRLLDVQELLSDSGVGRQQHVIVGQGQLDAVLTARPEDRRAIIEEAAGVLKYRRRRERAERRLEASESALARLQDLVGEVGRQLKPLARQAAASLRHDELVAERRALRLHLARTELGDLSERLSSGERRRAELDEETAITGADLARTWAALSLAEEAEAAEVPVEDLDPLARRLEGERQRALQLVALCRERRSAGAALVAALPSADEVQALESESARCAADLERTASGIAELAAEWSELEREESALAADEGDHLERFGADAAGLAPSPEIGEARAAAAAARDELALAREAAARAAERADAIAARVGETTERRERQADLARAAEAALVRARAEDEELASVAAARRAESVDADELLREAEEAVHAAQARVEALELALDEARARAGVERLASLPGVLGTLLDVVAVDERVGLAFEAALEGALAGVLVAGDEEARAALGLLRRDGLGGAVLPILTPRGPEVRERTGGEDDPPPRCEHLRSSVTSSDPAVDRLLDRLLEGVLVCHGTLDEALDIYLASPSSVVVTPAGDRLSAQGWRLGAGRAGATGAALGEARTLAAAAAARAAELAAAASAAAAAAAQARAASDAAARALDAAEADRRRAEEQAAELAEAIAALESERERVAIAHGAASAEVGRAAAALAALDDRLSLLERTESEAAARRAAAAAERSALDDRARELRSRRAQLEVRGATLEERRAALASRAEELVERVASRREAEELAGERRARCESDDRALGRLLELASGWLEALESGIGALAGERERRVAAESARRERLGSLRSRREALERVLAGIRERGQRLEIEMTEARVRREAAISALGRDLGVDPEGLGEVPLPSLGAEKDAAARLEVVESELGRIGPVNPLARDELAALEERSSFLAGQLEDVRSARRELGQVIDGVDREIVEVFTAAFSDVARHFSDLFTTLFPGGTGRLVLTAPDDPLSTGIEIDARPAGRNVRRLSLLSGGERSLVAMAFLFAVFRSRPSPFYMMDEVEAALDEVNLRRFLDLVEEFRDEAQLVIVSHQKRTMEVADALFGVSMQPGGSSKVVSERVRGRRLAPADRTVEAT